MGDTLDFLVPPLDSVTPGDKKLISDLTDIKRQENKEAEAAREQTEQRTEALFKEAEDDRRALRHSHADMMQNKWNPDEEWSKRQTDPLVAFGSIGSVFGILASAFTHAPLQNALNASASAMNAIHEGDAEAYKRAYTAWGDNTKLAIEREKLQQEEWQDAMQALNTNVALGTQKAQMIAAKNGDLKALAMLEAGMLPELVELQAKRADLAAKLQDNKMKMMLDLYKVQDLISRPGWDDPARRPEIIRQWTIDYSPGAAERFEQLQEEKRHNREMEGVARQAELGRMNRAEMAEGGRAQRAELSAQTRTAIATLSSETRKEIAAQTEGGREQRAEVSDRARREIASMNIVARRELQEYLEAGREMRSVRAEGGREQRAELSAQMREALAQLSDQTKRELFEQGEYGRKQRVELSEGARKELAKLNNDARRELQEYLEAGREARSVRLAGVAEGRLEETTRADKVREDTAQIKLKPEQVFTRLFFKQNPDAGTKEYGEGLKEFMADIKLGANATLDNKTLDKLAEQYMAGDKSVFQNLGRGTQGSANVVALRQKIMERMDAEGVTGTDVAVKMAEFEGFKAAQRVVAARATNIELFANEVLGTKDKPGTLNVAINASRGLPRSRFTDLNKVMLAAEEHTGDPKVVAFGAALNSLVNTYAKAISGGQQATVSDKDEARKIITRNHSPEQFEAAMEIIRQELEAARSAPGIVKKETEQLFRGSSAIEPSELPKGAHRIFYNEKGEPVQASN